jgi:Protein of unknown function (DUF3810)
VIRVALEIAVVAAAAAAALAPVPPAFIEHTYSRGLYAHLQPVVTAVSSRSPVALLDTAALVCLIGLAAAVARSRRREGAASALRHLVRLVVVGAAVCYVWFALFWGFNYRRIPLEEKLAYDASRITREYAVGFGRTAVERVNALQATESGALGSLDYVDLERAFADVEAHLGATRAARVAQPKRSLLQWYFRKAAVDGMTDPFFLEIILNPDLLPFERPFVVAHEWAHLAGYANEAEANFIAWLTCVTSGSAARYSGWLTAYEQVASGLPRDDRRALANALVPAVRADLVRAAQRFERSSPAVRTAARGAYDAYLRANRVEEGIASYNAVVRLMLGTSLDAMGKPQLRQP